VYLLWGSVYVAVRVVVENAPPLLSVGPRYVVAGSALALIAVGRRGLRAFRMSRTAFLGCCLLALLLPILTNGTVVVAVSLGVAAGPAALLSALTPISIAILRVADGDRPRLARWAAEVAGRGACRHPDGAAGFISSSLAVFEQETDDHLRGRCRRQDRGILPVAA